MTMPPALRIALLTHSVRARGGVVHTLELAEALVARGHRVTVIASAEPGETLFRPVGCEVALIRLPELVGDLVSQVRQRIETLALALPERLASGGFDVLHAQDSLSGNALATLREHGRLSAPWLRTVHHLDTFPQPVLNRWQARAWQQADGVACVSDAWQQHLQSAYGCHAERMFNGVNLSRFHPAHRASDEALLDGLGLRRGAGPVCLLVGGVEERKNTVRVLHAFAQLQRQDPAWWHAQLVIAGGASMLDHREARTAWSQALQALGLREGPGEAVLRTGPLPDPVMPALMRRATLLAMPSLVEGFGLAALEALACGTPVLVSRRPPFTEHLAGCDAVAWCDPEDVGDIADGLARAAALPRAVDVPQVCQRHSWSHSAALHDTWYRRTAQALARPESIALD